MSSAATREPHIDGLRSLAIVPVVLFHAGWSALPGGFVGVDIFFVISGYLITRILVTELDAGQFSLWRFYERRARRIMPALFVVLGVSAVVAALILLPRDLVLFGRSLVYSVLFASNVYFYDNTGYFDAEADSYALLHTWSLAVEEQFYLVFPLVLFVIWKLPRRWSVWIVAAVAAASFALSIATSESEPSFAFYLPFTRIWELMAGSLLALGAAPAIGRPVLREAISIASLLAIAATVLLLDEEAVFPGWIAAVPVLGAAALIRYAPGTLAGGLSTRLLVGIGLISYSLYLWHWPLLVFAAEWLIRPLAFWESTAIAGVSVVFAILSWKFVEQPFRSRTFLSRRTILAATIIGIGALAATAQISVNGDGFSARLPAEALRLEAARRDIAGRGCHDNDNRPVPPEAACHWGAEVAPTIAVWGDSHGIELSTAIGEIAAQQGKALVQLTTGACPPSLKFNPGARPTCSKRNALVFDYLLANPQLSTVILIASRPADSASLVQRVFKGTDEAVGILAEAGRTVVLYYPTAREPRSIPTRLAREFWRYGAFRPEIMTLEAFRKSRARTIDRLDKLKAKYNLPTVDPNDVYCPDGVCLAYRDGHVLYFDNHHPSMTGARMIAPLFADVIAAAAAP